MHGLIEKLNVVLRQGQDILRPLPQRGQAQAHHSDAVVEVRAQPPLLHKGLRVLVGGTHDAHIKMNVLPAADAPHLLLLQGLEQLGLHGGVHGVDLVQKQGAPVGQLEQALFGLRPGEPAPLGAEEHALQQIFRDGGAVLRQEGLVFPAAEGVEGLGKELLAGAGLPIDEGGRVIFRNGADGRLQPGHLLVPGDDVVQHRVVRRRRCRPLQRAHVQDLGDVHRPLDLPLLIQNRVGGGHHGDLEVLMGQDLLLPHRDLSRTQGIHHGAVLLGQLRIDGEQVVPHHIAPKLLRQLAEGISGLIILHNAVLIHHHHALHGLAVQVHQAGNLLQIFLHACPSSRISKAPFPSRRAGARQDHFLPSSLPENQQKGNGFFLGAAPLSAGRQAEVHPRRRSKIYRFLRFYVLHLKQSVLC